jgi:hypothetical protein
MLFFDISIIILDNAGWSNLNFLVGEGGKVKEGIIYPSATLRFANALFLQLDYIRQLIPAMLSTLPHSSL